MIDPRQRKRRLHFVGIGGIGMSGIAQVLANQGHSVSGSDQAESDSTRKLKELGVEVFTGHRAEYVQGVDAVVISSAIQPTNPEWTEARRLRIPVIQRAEMLAELMRGKLGIAVAGSHGKTTTTSMVSQILTQAALDPTLVIGGKVDSLGGGNAKLGQSDWMVVEADESDGSFLHLPATFCVVTNIDNDHLDHYENVHKIQDAFVDFVNALPFYGLAVVCESDPGVRKVLDRFHKPVVTVGLPDSDYFAAQVEQLGLGSRIHLLCRGVPWGVVEIEVPGAHNVMNAVAAVALCAELGIAPQTIIDGLRKFHGVKRRFEFKLRQDHPQYWIVDDYGHHPTEIAATLKAALQCKPQNGRVVVVFQPHRYSRTHHCRDEFARCFVGADLVLITDHYAAGEAPIEGVDSALIAGLAVEYLAKSGVKSVESKVFASGDLKQTKRELLSRVRPGDLILCMGAGSITRFADELAAAFLPGFSGDLLVQERLAQHTYYRIGGPADWFAIPRSEADLAMLSRWATEKEIPIFFLGLGSNLLVADSGFRGLVVKMSRVSTTVEVLQETAEGVRVRVGSGVAISSFVRQGAESGWMGIEIWAGIPGSVGGAVKMNAGTHLGDTAQICRGVRTFHFTTGQIRDWVGDELRFAYRKNLFLPKDHLILSADLEFQKCPSAKLKVQVQEMLARRKASQPIDFPSCGSVFKNPPEMRAWEVIEKIGLRGKQVGDAQFSAKHPNFIINLGQARASDVQALIQEAQSRAQKDLGIALETEVVRIGF